MPAIIAGIYTPEEVEDFKEDDRKVFVSPKKDEPVIENHEEKKDTDISLSFRLQAEIDECETKEQLVQLAEEIKSYPLKIRNEVRKYYAEKLIQLTNKEKENELQTDE
jgi:uncharacterized protein YihD (DUF1040 family)